MSYSNSPTTEEKTDRQNNTKTSNFCKNRKIVENKQTNYELYLEKIFAKKS